MIKLLGRQDSAVMLILLGSKELGINQFLEGEKQLLQWLGRAKDNVTIKGEQEIVDRIEREYANYLLEFSKMREMLSSEKQALLFYRKEMVTTYQAVHDACHDLRNINQVTRRISSGF